MRFKVGDRVVGCTGQVLEPWGTYAELVSARADRLTHIPAGVTFEQAAALPLAGMTAWQALAPSMPLSGKRVLILGGAGGVGHFAVQIAKSQGAYVAATCSSRNTEFVTQVLGADKAIDYTKENLQEAAGQPYDLVVDLVGEEPSSWGVLRRDGRMAAVSFDNTMKGRTGMWLAVLILTRVIRLKVMSALGLLPKYDNVMQSMGPDQGLKQLAQMVAEGRVKVHVDRVMSLEQLPDAHEYVEQGRTRGKVVIKVDSP
ncbi:hypothetical protein Vretimale_17264 [Volvox reticuliferus]|uniref:Enoyl reductase (ER) domain-containing protein n=1 Tax=Volvox reticuliferus TaxID=1737510 RepID=A0A8J4LXK3_9CHLO|nr:hypothetical protein Vretimale_17264 [Volvox reticuliferus]